MMILLRRLLLGSCLVQLITARTIEPKYFFKDRIVSIQYNDSENGIQELCRGVAVSSFSVIVPYHCLLHNHQDNEEILAEFSSNETLVEANAITYRISSIKENKHEIALLTLIDPLPIKNTNLKSIIIDILPSVGSKCVIFDNEGNTIATEIKSWNFCKTWDIKVPVCLETTNKNHWMARSSKDNLLVCDEKLAGFALSSSENAVEPVMYAAVSDSYNWIQAKKIDDIKVIVVYEETNTVPETSTVTEDPDTSTVTEDPETITVTEDPETSTVTEDPETSTVTEDPETSTVTEDPETSTVTEDPDTSTVTEDPGTSTVTEDPETSTVTEDPETSTVTEDPETSTVIEDSSSSSTQSSTEPSTEDSSSSSPQSSTEPTTENSSSSSTQSSTEPSTEDPGTLPTQSSMQPTTSTTPVPTTFAPETTTNYANVCTKSSLISVITIIIVAIVF